MNIVGPALFTRLGTDVAAVSALVGSRISPNLRKQDATLPAIGYQGSGSRHVKSHSGLDGLRRQRVDLNCYAATYAEVTALAEAVRVALDGQYGLVFGANTLSFLLLDGSGIYEAPIDATDKGVHTVNMDFAVWHEEATS